MSSLMWLSCPPCSNVTTRTLVALCSSSLSIIEAHNIVSHLLKSSRSSAWQSPVHKHPPPCSIPTLSAGYPCRGGWTAFKKAELRTEQWLWEPQGERARQQNTALLLVVASIYSDELEKFMESQGAANPGILILTTSLSKPFLRLDKYVTLLQELERHMEVGGMQDHRAGCAPGARA